MQNKGPLLDINKTFHIYKQRKQGNVLNKENIMLSNVLFDLLCERRNAGGKHCS
jgi:hypothetical protein